MSHVVVGLCALLLGVLIGMILRRPAPDAQSVDAAFRRTTSNSGTPSNGGTPSDTTADATTSGEVEGLRARAAEYRALLSKRDAMVAERDRYLAELEGRLRATEAEVMSLRVRSADSAPSAPPQPVFPQNPSMAAGNPIVARSGRGTMPVVPPNRRGTPIGAAARPPAEVDPADMTQEARASHSLLLTPMGQDSGRGGQVGPRSERVNAEFLDSDPTGEPEVAPATAELGTERNTVSAAGATAATSAALPEAEDAAGPSSETETAQAETEAAQAEAAAEPVVATAVPARPEGLPGADPAAEPDIAPDLDPTGDPVPTVLPLAAMSSTQPTSADHKPDVVEDPHAEVVLDDLTEIVGVGPKLAALLAEQGIHTFAQLAAISDADRASLEANLGSFRNRLERDDWIGQARDLSVRG